MKKGISLIQVQKPLKQVYDDIVKNNINKIYPKFEDTFKAFDNIELENLKVVILGQDPYPKNNLATGLAFGVPKRVPIIPKSLLLIKSNLKKFGHIGEFDQTLENWKDQGVLLMNTSLTVREGQPNSHKSIWEDFTIYNISNISKETYNVVWILWGSNAKSFKKYIHPSHNHFIIEGEHPVNRGGTFLSKDYFGETNKFLKENSITPVKWGKI